MKLLHSDAPTDGNGADVPPINPPIQPSTPPAPPAAQTVATGKTERELELERQLEAERNETAKERAERVERERTICEMQDEHHRYRKTVEAKPAKAEKKSGGWTFFDN